MMSLLKSILDFYIRSSLHVAVCFVALSMVVIGRYHILEENLRFCIMHFCLVVSAYNFVKYFDLWRQKKSFRFKKAILILTLVSAIASGVLLIPELLNIYPFIVGLVVLVLVYVYPTFTSKNLRHYAYLKLPIIALCWVVLIASYGHSEFIFQERNEYQEAFLGITNCFGPWPSFWKFNAVFYFSLISYFFFIMALCIPFEIRDVKYDPANLKTIPQLIGIKKTKWLGYLFLMLSFIGYNIYWNWSSFLIAPYGLIEIIIFSVTAISIYFSDKFKSDYYASFFVEAIPVLWLVLYWFF